MHAHVALWPCLRALFFRQVLVLDNLCRSHAGSLERALRSAADELQMPKQELRRLLGFLKVDLRDKKRLEESLRFQRFDAVIHFAGFKSVPESLKAEELYWSNNVGGFEKLLSVLRDYAVSEAMLLSSSCTVYKPSAGQLDEDSALEPTCPYGETKHLSLKASLKADLSWMHGCGAVS